VSKGADHPVEPVPLTWLFNFVKPFSVRVTSTSGGNHVPTSYHYRHRAVDVVGTAKEMERLALAALRRPASFREMFYDPMGSYIKNGVVKPGRIGGHTDHVHIAR
jgi:hypothetical protein